MKFQNMRLEIGDPDGCSRNETIQAVLSILRAAGFSADVEDEDYCNEGPFGADEDGDDRCQQDVDDSFDFEKENP